MIARKAKMLPVSRRVVMGGMAAGASLAKRRDHPHDPPHIVLLPEIAFNPEKFAADVKRVADKYLDINQSVTGWFIPIVAAPEPEPKK